MTNRPLLIPLHSPDLLSQPKLEGFRRLETSVIVESLEPGNEGALTTKSDGTIMDGHHRIVILKERGFDVEQLPREILDPGEEE